MDYRVADVLISKEQIAHRVEELGQAISEKYKDQQLVVICILRGAAVFMTDLVRAIDPSVDLSLEFMRVSSYGSGTCSSGEVRILQDLDNPVKGKRLLIVEDIVDSGLTLLNLKGFLEQREPESIEICVFLDKKERRQVDIEVDYCGFEIPDEFVVGYGLDYAEHWRQLPAVHVARPVEERN